jgi:hypothetical protein
MVFENLEFTHFPGLNVDIDLTSTFCEFKGNFYIDASVKNLKEYLLSRYAVFSGDALEVKEVTPNTLLVVESSYDTYSHNMPLHKYTLFTQYQQFNNKNVEAMINYFNCGCVEAEALQDIYPNFPLSSYLLGLSLDIDFFNLTHREIGGIIAIINHDCFPKTKKEHSQLIKLLEDY